MASEPVYIILISLAILSASVAVLLFFLYRNRKKENSLLKEELENYKNNLEQKVKERTRQLEMVRDSVSEYAVQKFELAEELKLKNQQIIRQKDDIQKQTERLQLAYDEIKKLDSFKYQMTRMIIHDLKNPLNVLLNVADTMKIPQKPAKIIKQISIEMLDLVMNILDVNKFEDSKMKISYDSFDLSVPVSKLAEKFSFLSRNSSIELKVSIPSPCIINSDMHIIERVLENLLSNAFKYTPPEGCIEILATDIDDKVRIEIRDNGAGIPPKLLNEIFDEYVQGSDKSFVYTNSTGIGLTYCKLAIEAQGGEIGLVSKQGEGTTVWFLTQKGSSKGLDKSGLITEIAGPGQKSQRLNSNDIAMIRPYLDQIKSKGIFEVSAIINILGNEVFDENERLSEWKDAVEASVFSAKEKLFRELTGL